MSTDGVHNRRQFRLSSLLIGVAVVAGLLGIFRLFLSILLTLPGSDEWHEGRAKFVGASILILCLALGVIGLLGMKNRRDGVIATLLVAAQVLLLGFSGASCWFTCGEVLAGGVWFVSLFVIAPAALCAAREYVVSIIASIVILLIVVPFIAIPQVAYLVQLKQLQAEVEAFAAHADQVRKETGQYPANISGYDSPYPKLRKYLKYWSPQDLEDENYIISVDLYGSDGTNREYSARSGWYYYPD